MSVRQSLKLGAEYITAFVLFAGDPNEKTQAAYLEARSAYFGDDVPTYALLNSEREPGINQ